MNTTLRSKLVPASKLAGPGPGLAGDVEGSLAEEENGGAAASSKSRNKNRIEDIGSSRALYPTFPASPWIRAIGSQEPSVEAGRQQPTKQQNVVEGLLKLGRIPFKGTR